MSAGGKITIEIDGDERAALIAFQNLSDSQRKLVAEVGKTGVAAEKAANQSIQASKDTEAARRKQITTAGQLVTKSESLSQSYTRQKNALDAALKSGKITADQHAQALGHIRTKADEASKKISGMKAATEKGVGKSAQDKVTQFAARFVTIAAAVNVVKQALQFYNEELDRARGETDNLVDARASLRQVSKGDLGQLEEKSDKLASDSKLGIDRVQARNLVFAARSTGFEGEERQVASADPVIPVEVGQVFAGAFRKFFSSENLSVEKSFNTGLAAAASSQFNIVEILPELRKAAQGNLSGDFESSDISAAVGVLGADFGNQIGNRLRILGTKLSTNDSPELQGKNLIDAVAALKANPELRADFTGENSELKAIISKFLQRESEIRTVDKQIELAQGNTGGRRSLIRSALKEAEDESTTAGAIEVARQASVAAEQRKLIAEETRFSATGNKLNAAVADAVGGSVEAGDGLSTRLGTKLGANIGKLTGDEKKVSATGEFFGALFGDFGLKKMFAANKGLEEAEGQDQWFQEKFGERLRLHQEQNAILKAINDKTKPPPNPSTTTTIEGV